MVTIQTEKKEVYINSKLIKSAEILQGTKNPNNWYIKIFFIGETEGTLYGEFSSLEACKTTLSTIIAE